MCCQPWWFARICPLLGHCSVLRDLLCFVLVCTASVGVLSMGRAAEPDEEEEEDEYEDERPAPRPRSSSRPRSKSRERGGGDGVAWANGMPRLTAKQRVGMMMAKVCVCVCACVCVSARERLSGMCATHSMCTACEFHVYMRCCNKQ